MADSIYDALVDEPEPEADAVDGVFERVAADVFVCDVIEDDVLCGAVFDNARSLHMHTIGKHRDRSDDAPRKPMGTGKPRPSRARATNSKDKAPRKAAARATPPPSADRAATYASSIAMAALGAYLVVPPFDQTDLDIVNRGAPNLADALAQAGDQNQTIRTTCDLILGGGAGGAYIQLLLALSAIVVPICAHHGLVPASAGNRFGEMIGAQPTAAPPASTEPPAASGSAGQPDFANMGPDEVLAFFSQVPPTVLFDLAGKMFGNMEPDVVDIGAVPQGENLSAAQVAAAVDPYNLEGYGDGAGERGSEQPAPESVPTPA